MSSELKQGVILAAGRGSRIFPLSEGFPKPLLPILNKPILEYQLEAMRNAGVEEVIIVIGETGEKIKKHLGNGAKFGIKITYVFDKKPQGIASSLMCAKEAVLGPFALFLGDIFIPKMDISSAMNRFWKEGADGVIIAKRERNLEKVKRNFAVVIDGNNRVTKVEEKPKNPQSNLKGYGLYIFNEKIFDAVTKTPRSILRNEYEITDSIETFVRMGANVVCDIWDSWDFNLSYPEDLLKCNLKMLSYMKLKKLIAQNSKVNILAKINNSIVGERSVIDSPISLVRCLVFSDTKVQSNLRLARDMIFARDLILTINAHKATHN